jgi:hypothetical protein
VNTWATPKGVSGVFFGRPASVRPITFSIVISFLFLDEPTTVTITTNNKAVKDCDGLPPLFANCLEEVFSETRWHEGIITLFVMCYALATPP